MVSKSRKSRSIQKSFPHSVVPSIKRSVCEIRRFVLNEQKEVSGSERQVIPRGYRHYVQHVQSLLVWSFDETSREFEECVLPEFEFTIGAVCEDFLPWDGVRSSKHQENFASSASIAPETFSKIFPFISRTRSPPASMVTLAM